MNFLTEIYKGNFISIPQKAPNSIRIFLSSTFKGIN